MSDGNWWRQEEFHGQSSENALRDHRAKRNDGESTQPAASLNTHDPDGKDDRHEADSAGEETMTVLIKNAANHFRWRKGIHELAVSRRPIGNGEAGAVAGNAGPGNDQQKRGDSEQAGKSMEPA